MTPAAVRTQRRKNSGYVYDMAVIKRDVSKATASYILEHQLSVPGVEIQSDYLRDYPQGDLAAQVLGYLGEISAAQLKQPQFRDYTPGDVVGESGVEYTYDRWLRAGTEEPGSRSTAWADPGTPDNWPGAGCRSLATTSC